jgi:hypothetical protein
MYHTAAIDICILSREARADDGAQLARCQRERAGPRPTLQISAPAHINDIEENSRGKGREWQRKRHKEQRHDGLHFVASSAL